MQGIDADLIHRCKAKDEKALYTLYHECYSLMKSIVVRYVFDKNEVSDVMNRGFVKVVGGLSRYDSAKPFAPWLATIIINESLDYVRRTMRLKAKELAYREEMHAIQSAPVSRNYADLDFDAQYLLDAFQVLSPRTRTVFNLFAIDGFSHKEIAKKLNISTGTSKWHVSSARDLLQKELGKKTPNRKTASQ